MQVREPHPHDRSAPVGGNATDDIPGCRGRGEEGRDGRGVERNGGSEMWV